MVKDSIILTVIPRDIPRSLKSNEILLCDIEKLRDSIMLTIHINEPYSPFQTGQTFYNVYAGFPVKTNVKNFMIKAIELNSNDIYDYKQLTEPELLPNNNENENN